MSRSMIKIRGRDAFDGLALSLGQRLEPGFALALHLEPGDGTRYVLSLVHVDDRWPALLVGMQCPDSFGLEVDPRYPVEPDGLRDLAQEHRRRYPLNAVTVALACDVVNWAAGHQSSFYSSLRPR